MVGWTVQNLVMWMLSGEDGGEKKRRMNQTEYTEKNKGNGVLARDRSRWQLPAFESSMQEKAWAGTMS